MREEKCRYPRKNTSQNGKMQIIRGKKYVNWKRQKNRQSRKILSLDTGSVDCSNLDSNQSKWFAFGKMKRIMEKTKKKENKIQFIAITCSPLQRIKRLVKTVEKRLSKRKKDYATTINWTLDWTFGNGVARSSRNKYREVSTLNQTHRIYHRQFELVFEQNGARC